MSSQNVSAIELTSFPQLNNKENDIKRDKEKSTRNLKGKNYLPEVPEIEYKNSGAQITKQVTIAGGVLDFTLLAANIEHLKFVLLVGPVELDFYYPLLYLICISISIQIVIGVLLFITGFTKHDKQNASQSRISTIINHVTNGLVGLIAILNIAISSFGDRGEFMHKFKQARDNQTFYS